MVTDPYSVLGVSKDATKEEIKKAYRQKAKQYHPDLHPDDPSATEKMNEINEAYDMLNNPEKYKQRNQNYGGSNDPGNSNGNPYGNYGGQQWNGQGRQGSYGGYGDFDPFGYDNIFRYGQRRADVEKPEYEPGDSEDIRQAVNYIRMGQYGYANQILNRVISMNRNARWFYLSSLANYGQGNTIQATEQIKKALQMEPGNLTYQRAMQSMGQTGTAYNQASEEVQRYAEGMNRLCMGFCMAQFCCMFCRF